MNKVLCVCRSGTIRSVALAKFIGELGNETKYIGYEDINSAGDLPFPFDEITDINFADIECYKNFVERVYGFRDISCFDINNFRHTIVGLPDDYDSPDDNKLLATIDFWWKHIINTSHARQ